MSKQKSFHIPAGYMANLTTDAISSGSYVRFEAGGTQYTPTDIAASADINVGPFNEPRDYKINALVGDINIISIVSSGYFTAADEAAIAVSDALLAPKASPTFTGTVVLPSTTSIGTITNTELSYVDGVTSAIQTQLNAKAPTLVASNVGVANTGITAIEYGDGFQHTTVLSVTSTLPAIAGGAALSVGKLLYTFPAGAIIVDKAYMNMAITQSEAHITADTPDVGLGTIIAAGANALLSDTSGSENIITGQTAADCDGTASVKTIANQILVIEAGDDHTMYFNVADTWAADGDAAAAISGNVVIHWQFLA